MISEEDERLECLRLEAACAECGIDDIHPFYSIHRRTFFGTYEELAERIFETVGEYEANHMKRLLTKEFDCTREHLMAWDAQEHTKGHECSTVSDLARIFRLSTDAQYMAEMLSVYRTQLLPTIEKYKDAREAELKLAIKDFREKRKRQEEQVLMDSWGK